MKQEDLKSFVPIDHLLSARDDVLIQTAQEMKWLKCKDRLSNSIKIALQIQVDIIAPAID